MQAAESGIKAGSRPILLATLGLLVVWVIGRTMETAHGNAVFDAALTYWFGLAVALLLLLWLFGAAWQALEAFPAARR
ncbi:hypothetical protein Q6326_31330, partial [Klebsiella pneumoniae]|nr:hypothetical protein [Klebsiella pneumoniae]